MVIKIYLQMAVKLLACSYISLMHQWHLPKSQTLSLRFDIRS